MIFVIDDDEIMARCIGRATKRKYRVFRDGIMAMEAIENGELPELIFLDILLNGPDGFTFLNELVSYDDTAKIPVVVVSSLKFSKRQLASYGVVAVLDKDEMRPEEILELVERYGGDGGDDEDDDGDGNDGNSNDNYGGKDEGDDEK